MQTKRLVTELLIPTVLLSLLSIAVLMVGLLLGLSNDALVVVLTVTVVALVLVEEPLMAWLLRRVGLPPPRQITRRHGA